MKNEHTPGPWVAEINEDRGTHYEINAPNYFAVCDICGVLQSVPDSQWETIKANAELIAAAPELLESLKMLVSLTDRKHDAWDKARAAIAKATGKTP